MRSLKTKQKKCCAFSFLLFFFLTAANCLYCTKLSTCTEETAILDGMEIYTWPRKSSPTSQWVEERCGINLDISKQELASERPSPWGIFPQRWEKKKLQSDTVTCSAQGSSRWVIFSYSFLKGWALKWKSYTRWIKSYSAVYKMLSNHRHTGLWSVWAARLRLQLSELWKGNKPNYLIGFLPLSLRTERNHWESRIRVNNEQKRKKKLIL